jgi:hypothetical protein
MFGVSMELYKNSALERGGQVPPPAPSARACAPGSETTETRNSCDIRQNFTSDIGENNFCQLFRLEQVILRLFSCKNVIFCPRLPGAHANVDGALLFFRHSHKKSLC